MNRSAVYILSLLVILHGLTVPVHSQRTKSSLNAGQQRHAEKGLKDNNRFFFFIASTITNSGTENEKKLFTEAVRRDFLARLLYMKFRFSDSFREIRKAQELLIQVYTLIITRETEGSRKLLNSIAPAVIQQDDFRSRHYLRLGYRSTAESLIMKGMADSYRETLYSMRLYKYVRAIKKAKYSRRYAVLARLETVRSDKEKIAPVNTSFKPLLELIQKKLTEKQEFYVTLHYDNYYRTSSGKTLYDQIWEKPQLETLPEYKDYMSTR